MFVMMRKDGAFLRRNGKFADVVLDTQSIFQAREAAALLRKHPECSAVRVLFQAEYRAENLRASEDFRANTADAA